MAADTNDYEGWWRTANKDIRRLNDQVGMLSKALMDTQGIADSRPDNVEDLVLCNDHEIQKLQLNAQREISLAWVPRKVHAVSLTVGVALGVVGTTLWMT